jgi:glucose/arabinose dehydrogenase
VKAAAVLALLLVSIAPAFAQFDAPSVKDPDFVVERFASGIPGPTAMAFVGDDLLVLQKDDGKVRLIRGGVLQPDPLLDVSVANVAEQGLLGAAVSGQSVYIYFSESLQDGDRAVGRRVYKYDWTGSALENPVLVRDMNLIQTYHNGGGMAVGPDGTVYLAVGDAGRYGLLQNHDRGFYPDTSAIIPIAPEGPYHAMGLRNSFGIAFDPFTETMWGTENGDDSYDEINLVYPYMNSGWNMVMGPSNATALARIPGYQNYTYSEPEFTWEQPVAPTGLSFARSEPLAKFADSLFVGACNTGTLYKFTMNEQRDGFAFASAELADGVANRGEPMDEIVFGTNLGCITDIEVGPDGLLYIASFGKGAIFRLAPAGYAAPVPAPQQDPSLPLYLAAGVAGTAIASAYLIMRRKKSPA